MSMTYEKNLERLQTVALTKGLRLNADNSRLEKVIGMMTDNFSQHGLHYCPCKQQNDIPQPKVDVTCPCENLNKEIEAQGHCKCRVFYTK